MKYKHIIWDWNGTLFDDVHLCLEIINNVLRKRNMETLSLQKYKTIFTIPVENYYKKAGFNFEDESFEIVGKEWMDEYEKRKYEAALTKGALETVKKIYDYGISQSILSAYKQNTLEEIVAKFGLTKFMSNVVGLNHIYATGKLELGKSLIKKLNNGTNEILFIGDTLHDFEVAKELGAGSVLLSSGHQNKQTLLSCNVPVLDDFSELNLFLFG